jgi:hypothetical protein
MLDITTLSLAERRICLEGVRMGLIEALVDPAAGRRALEVADLELQLTF